MPCSCARPGAILEGHRAPGAAQDRAAVRDLADANQLGEGVAQQLKASRAQPEAEAMRVIVTRPTPKA